MRRLMICLAIALAGVSSCTRSQYEWKVPVLPPPARVGMSAVIEGKAMALAREYRCFPGGRSGAKLFANACWSDFVDTCTAAPQGRFLVVRCEYTDATRMLAACRDPSLLRQLSRRERRALEAAQRHVAWLISDGMADVDKVRSIHDHLLRGSRFASGEEAAATLILERRGCCAAYSRAAFLMLTLAHVSARIVCGDSGGAHVWNMVCVEGDWYHLDITKDAGRPGSAPHYRYFCCTDAQLAHTHRWNRAAYPSTPAYSLPVLEPRKSPPNKSEGLLQFAAGKSRERHDATMLTKRPGTTMTLRTVLPPINS